jgi:hypothetical protein
MAESGAVLAAAQDSRSSIVRRSLYGAIPAVLLAIIWAPLLSRSFWVDEAGTYFVAHRGLAWAIEQSWRSPGQSVLYGAIASLFYVSSETWKEFTLRIPSLAGALGAGILVSRFARKLFGPAAGLVAVVTFFISPLIQTLGTQARPYGLAIFVVTGSWFMLWRSLEDDSGYSWAGFVLFSILVVYTHYLFTICFVSQLLFIAYCNFTGPRVPLRKCVAAWCAVAASAVPLLPHLALLMRQGHTLSYASAPGRSDLHEAILPAIEVTAVIASVILLLLFDRSEIPHAPPRGRGIALATCWWIVGPLLLFAISRLTPYHIFIDRYYGAARPAFSLMAAAFCASLLSVRQQRWAALVIACVTCANPFVVASNYRSGRNELGPPIKYVHDISSGSAAPPLLLSSLYYESNTQAWEAGFETTPALAPQLTAYPVRNRVYPLPLHIDDRARSFLTRTMREDLSKARCVLMLTRIDFDPDGWVQSLFQASGFTADPKAFGNIRLVVFRRS